MRSNDLNCMLHLGSSHQENQWRQSAMTLMFLSCSGPQSAALPIHLSQLNPTTSTLTTMLLSTLGPSSTWLLRSMREILECQTGKEWYLLLFNNWKFFFRIFTKFFLLTRMSICFQLLMEHAVRCIMITPSKFNYKS